MVEKKTSENFYLSVFKFLTAQIWLRFLMVSIFKIFLAETLYPKTIFKPNFFPSFLFQTWQLAIFMFELLYLVSCGSIGTGYISQRRKSWSNDKHNQNPTGISKLLLWCWQTADHSTAPMPEYYAGSVSQPAVWYTSWRIEWRRKSHHH